MTTRGCGRTWTPREYEEGTPRDNQATLLAAMTTLVNAMHTNIVATNQAMERMNGNNNRLGGNSVDGCSMTLATFLKVNPSMFKGSTDPTEAYNWFQAIERALQLSAEAQYWWQGAHRLLQQGNGDEAKKLELLQLKQGSMSVAAYTSKFEELCHFLRVCQGAPKGYRGWKCMKYQDGLRDYIMQAVAPLEVKSFAKLINKSGVVEECCRKTDIARSDNRESHEKD
ncbi:uncharacterized protein LOC130945344 [Arachis stenosperma]|uniref:uncharacterized protein LOC130945344 n=1 Tax=Arachis stenosperma TaxID=217475 RepID=UPI0025AD66C1|nr:uncharacterized protein LOC130945344 [Arachis stenosperma]